jgi:hypothetical protein
MFELTLLKWRVTRRGTGSRPARCGENFLKSQPACAWGIRGVLCESGIVRPYEGRAAAALSVAPPVVAAGPTTAAKKSPEPSGASIMPALSADWPKYLLPLQPDRLGLNRFASTISSSSEDGALGHVRLTKWLLAMFWTA